MSTTTFEERYRVVFEKIFNNWQNLRLAVEHGMGGRHGQMIAIEIMDYTYQYCIRNDKISVLELQEVLEDLMDQEFNTICEDGSIAEISRHLLHYKELCLKEEQYERVIQELSTLPVKEFWLTPKVKIVPMKTSGDDSSSSDDEDDDTSEDANGKPQCTMDVDDISMSMEQPITTAQQENMNGNAMNQMEEEPGWTTVRRSQRK